MMVFGEPVYRSARRSRRGTLGGAHRTPISCFFGAVGIWLTNMLAAVVRAGGNMSVPSVAMMTDLRRAGRARAAGLVSVGFGGESFPKLGMAGIALPAR